MTKNEKILVTGSVGFIGSSLVMRLLDDGYQVVGIDNHNDYYDPSLKEDRLNLFIQRNNYKHCRISIEDKQQLSNIIRDFAPSIIVHLAAQAGVRYSMENPESYINSNLVGFGNILECSRNYGVGHLVYASSSSVYGASTQMPFSVRNSSDHPISLYGATKKANEAMAHAYSHLYNIPTTGLRFFTVYGPWGRPDMALYKFTKAILSGKKITIFNEGNHKRDFTYIDDIVAGILKVIEKGPQVADINWSSSIPENHSSEAPWKVFNLGNGKPVKLAYFIELIEDNLGIKAEKEYLPMQPGDVIETFADISETQEFFGYSPKIEVEVGIANFIQWYKKYQNV